MVISDFIQMLQNAGIPDACFDFRCMLEQITGNKYSVQLSASQEQQLLTMIQRRISGEPLQYILGEWEFYGLRIFVGEGVLIPRPETELLVDTVLDWCKAHPVGHIIDLCTGSGCIALALKKHLPDVLVSAVDISETALHYARKNAEYHHLPVTFYHADVTDKDFIAQFRNLDIIVSNPPYLTVQEMAELQTEVQHEPALALYGGSAPDGTYFYQNITSGWQSSLSSGGMLAYEIGWQQSRPVTEILTSYAFHSVRVIQDYEHRDRIVSGQKI